MKEIGNDTKNCVVCGDTAVIWFGHVHKEIDQPITAGFCNKHREFVEFTRGDVSRYHRSKKTEEGCLGSWIPRDGILPCKY